MPPSQNITHFRVRYSETDQMRTYYNSRALEWFEQGRTEHLRAMGKPYTEMEKLGVMLPVREAHVEFLGKAEYDDLLKMTTTLVRSGKARIRCDVEIERADSGASVCRGWTVHAIANTQGKAIRPPAWLVELLEFNS